MVVSRPQKTLAQTHHEAFPAPRRMYVKGENGKYHSAPWDMPAILQHLKSGGHFDFNNTEFADPKTQEGALIAQRFVLAQIGK